MLHNIENRVGRTLPIKKHNISRRRQPLSLIVQQCLLDGPVRSQTLGECFRIQNGLTRAIGTERLHRVRRITEQRDAPTTPEGQRVLVDHRVAQNACRLMY